MIRYFFKIFGVIFAVLVGLVIGILGICIALSFSTIAGIITFILVVSIFIATLVTLVNHYLF